MSPSPLSSSLFGSDGSTDDRGFLNGLLLALDDRTAEKYGLRMRVAVVGDALPPP